MSIFDKFKNKAAETTRYKLVSERGNSVYVWNGNAYESDIVRACLRVEAAAFGKAVLKHARGYGESTVLNPEPYIRFLLEEPNPYMSMQQLLEKMDRQLSLNANAFALIVRNDDGLPVGIYPINAGSAEAIFNDSGDLFLRFSMLNGKIYTFPYSDIIHLRTDFGNNDIFGSSPAAALSTLMTNIGTVDKSIVAAINNGSIIKWLLKYNTSTRPEDLKKGANEFAEQFLSTANGTGVAAVDNKAEAQQITPTDYVPNAALTDRVTKRIYSFFGTNEKILQSSYSGDEWNAYYESRIEPRLIDLTSELTRKLFTRKERSFGNRIVAESSNVAYASMQTKLDLSKMVDRGAMTPNEWRAVMNLTSIKGGDEPIRRLDTAAIEDNTKASGNDAAEGEV